MSARQLGRRLLELLGLRLEEVPDQPELEATDPVDTTWCNYTWRAPDADHNLVDHVCDLELGHGDAEHVCGCGSQEAAPLLRLVTAGRDCLGVCTNCNSGPTAWHAPSCPHYDLLCQLYGLDPAQLLEHLEDQEEEEETPSTAAPDRSPAASRARARGTWRVAEAGRLAHLVEHGPGQLCGSRDAGPWRAVSGALRCAACVDLSEVLARHG